MSRRQHLWAAIVLVPAVVSTGIFVYGFIAWTGWASLTDWNTIRRVSGFLPPAPYLGLDNYQAVFATPRFWTNDVFANLVIAQLLFLEAEDPEKDINLYVNSPGGSVTAGLGIYDTMQYVKPPINTICLGQAASMGALLLTAGTKGKRFALPNARVMIHQPLGGFQGQASDFQIHAKEILGIKLRLNEILAHHTGQPLEVVERDTDRDNFMGAEEAVKYGLIDKVQQRRAESAA